MSLLLVDEPAKDKFRVLTVVMVVERGDESSKWLWDSASLGRPRNGVLVRGMTEGDMIAVNMELTKKIEEVANKVAENRIEKLEKMNQKLRNLILLTDDSVSDRTVGDLTLCQWKEFERWEKENEP